jgi:hypothetical protein
MDQAERELLARIAVQIERCSDFQRRLAKRGRVLRDAATMLRLGRRYDAVVALIGEQVPDAVVTVTAHEEEE